MRSASEIAINILTDYKNEFYNMLVQTAETMAPIEHVSASVFTERIIGMQVCNALIDDIYDQPYADPIDIIKSYLNTYMVADDYDRAKIALNVLEKLKGENHD